VSAKIEPEKVTRPSKQHQILFVDDERAFLETVSTLFVDWSNQSWKVHIATSADQALQFLKDQIVELVVVDINMPVLDGVQFLRVINRRFPDLKKAVLTGHATEAKRSECLASGAELFIEKPQSSDGFRAIFAMLDELITWSPREGFQGMLRKVGLQDVIQMECLGRNSSVLEIHNQHLRGRVYIEDGSIIHAGVGDLTGEPALHKLLSLSGGSFQLQPFEAPLQRTIQGQWEFLLMEAARVRDEMSLQAAEASGAETADADADSADQPDGVKVVETLICSGTGEVLHAWQCSEADARVGFLKALSALSERFAQELPMGKFDRVEIQNAAGRGIAQVHADRMVFVRMGTEGLPV
jgi:CheY-like chemotaxis protein